MITVSDKGLTAKQIARIEPKTPKNAGSRWKPIPHGELVHTLKEEIADRGWDIDREMYATAEDGANMTGAFLLSGVKGPRIPKGLQLAMGFLNSNSRRYALQVTVGAEVAVCRNGICTGSIVLSRIHDHTVNLPNEVSEGVDRFVTEAKGIPLVVRGLKQARLSDGDASEILLEAGRRNLVGWTAIGRVDAEYRNPTYPEHGKGTAWALLNAFTFAARPSINPTRQMEIFNTFRGLLPGGVDLN